MQNTEAKAQDDEICSMNQKTSISPLLRAKTVAKATKSVKWRKKTTRTACQKNLMNTHTTQVNRAMSRRMKKMDNRMTDSKPARIRFVNYWLKKQGNFRSEPESNTQDLWLNKCQNLLWLLQTRDETSKPSRYYRFRPIPNEFSNFTILYLMCEYVFKKRCLL